MANNYLITGGAGFIGSNYVSRLLERGESVTVYDNLSRAGAVKNIEWLRKSFGNQSFRMIEADIRDEKAVNNAIIGIDVVVHLAGQVAVTTSVSNPREDFDINAYGTFNVLDAARKSEKQPVFIFASTNKVYGGMEDVEVELRNGRYQYAQLPFGISEKQPLDFHSPYGCSKGTGDQYIRDYYRIYGIPSVVLRQSCIYGPRQFGIEDQGWLAWFIIAALLERDITIYGDGKQVRDVLFIEDLLDVYDKVIKNIGTTAGQVFNIGGGPKNTISVWSEFKPILEELLDRELNVIERDWRPGDQKVYISDIRKAEEAFGWSPKNDVASGIKKLYNWVSAHKTLFQG